MTTRLVGKFLLAGTVVFLALGAGVGNVARGEIIRWVLQDVAFDDGGTASGFFTVDSSILPDRFGSEVIEFAIETTGGTTIATPFTYARGGQFASRFLSNGKPFQFFSEAAGPLRLLNLDFSVDLMLSGPGTVSIIPSDSSSETTDDFGDPQFERRVISGFVVAVPEPSLIVFVGFGVLCMVVAAAGQGPRMHDRT
ncbi:MAG: hypothetical protein ABI612_19035 [Betaproteobacteria bacterium]